MHPIGPLLPKGTWPWVVAATATGLALFLAGWWFFGISRPWLVLGLLAGLPILVVILYLSESFWFGGPREPRK